MCLVVKSSSKGEFELFLKCYQVSVLLFNSFDHTEAARSLEVQSILDYIHITYLQIHGISCLLIVVIHQQQILMLIQLNHVVHIAWYLIVKTVKSIYLVDNE